VCIPIFTGNDLSGDIAAASAGACHALQAKRQRGD
jgi:hypothetical protein